jgi:hypothetical protein
MFQLLEIENYMLFLTLLNHLIINIQGVLQRMKLLKKCLVAGQADQDNKSEFGYCWFVLGLLAEHSLWRIEEDHKLVEGQVDKNLLTDYK